MKNKTKRHRVWTQKQKVKKKNIDQRFFEENIDHIFFVESFLAQNHKPVEKRKSNRFPKNGKVEKVSQTR